MCPFARLFLAVMGLLLLGLLPWPASAQQSCNHLFGAFDLMLNSGQLSQKQFQQTLQARQDLSQSIANWRTQGWSDQQIEAECQKTISKIMAIEGGRPMPSQKETPNLGLPAMPPTSGKYAAALPECYTQEALAGRMPEEMDDHIERAYELAKSVQSLGPMADDLLPDLRAFVIEECTFEARMAREHGSPADLMPGPMQGAPLTPGPGMSSVPNMRVAPHDDWIKREEARRACEMGCNPYTNDWDAYEFCRQRCVQ
jgi:hypothetical protein